MRDIYTKLTGFLGSRRFFYIVLALLIFDALWFVFSAVYPMAFDEEFHFGIISIYAQQWSPFLSAQPPGGDVFGALVSDPSYLYHYVMSFPYRIIALFTDNQTTQVILLRLINVALFAWSVVLFRKVLLRTKVSPALAHCILLVLVLIPIVPMLAAQINYDNLLMVLVAWMCLLVLNIVEGLRHHAVRMRSYMCLALACITMSLVKYAALPIMAVAVGFVAYKSWRSFRGRGKRFLPACRRDLAVLSPVAKTALIALLLISAVLFVQRYGVNMYRYHTPVPECDVVLSERQCSSYGPWQRNHLLAQNRGDIEQNALEFTATWVHDLWKRMFFAVNGPASQYATRLPLPVPGVAAATLGFVGLIAVIVFWRPVFRDNYALQFFTLVIVGYAAVLWTENYSQYVYTGVPVAINGRYLLPVAVLMGAVVGRALSIALRKCEHGKVLFASTALLLLLWGGGVMTFIVRSDSTWNWPNPVVVDVNDAARSVLRPIIFLGLDR